MPQPHDARARAAKAAGHLHAADHEWHPCLEYLMRRYGYSFEVACEWITACRSEMRRLGKVPQTRCDCRDKEPFRS